MGLLATVASFTRPSARLGLIVLLTGTAASSTEILVVAEEAFECCLGRTAWLSYHRNRGCFATHVAPKDSLIDLLLIAADFDEFAGC